METAEQGEQDADALQLRALQAVYACDKDGRATRDGLELWCGMLKHAGLDDEETKQRLEGLKLDGWLLHGLNFDPARRPTAEEMVQLMIKTGLRDERVVLSDQEWEELEKKGEEEDEEEDDYYDDYDDDEDEEGEEGEEFGEGEDGENEEEAEEEGN